MNGGQGFSLSPVILIPPWLEHRLGVIKRTLFFTWSKFFTIMFKRLYYLRVRVQALVCMMCVCVCVCVCACMCACLCVLTRACVFVHVCVSARVRARVHACLHFIPVLWLVDGEDNSRGGGLLLDGGQEGELRLTPEHLHHPLRDVLWSVHRSPHIWKDTAEEMTIKGGNMLRLLLPPLVYGERSISLLSMRRSEAGGRY